MESKKIIDIIESPKYTQNKRDILKQTGYTMTRIIKSFTVFTAAAILLTSVVPSIVEAVGDQGLETPQEQTEEDRRKLVKDNKAEEDVETSASNEVPTSANNAKADKELDALNEKETINKDQVQENRSSGPDRPGPDSHGPDSHGYNSRGRK